MNKVILMGRLVRDVEMRNPIENAFARYTLAVERRFAKRDDPNAQTADFINCVAFGKAAEFADKYFRQGTRIAIVGRLQSGKYTNKDGQTVYTTDVVVEEQEFAQTKAESNQGSQPVQPQTPAAGQPTNGFMDVPEDEADLPFN